MRIFAAAAFCSVAILLTACSNSAPTPSVEVKTVAAGEKAEIGHLSYTIIDSQIQTKLGDEANPRIPKERFIILQLSVSNSGNTESPIPAVELVADNGQTYGELSDGVGVQGWLGMFRKVGPTGTERGTVAFDAPAAHYKVRFSDEQMNQEILADLPLSYMHERAADVIVPTVDGGADAPSGALKPVK